MSKANIYLFLVIIVTTVSCKQSSTVDRGPVLKTELIAELESEVCETSALVFHDSFLYTVNDSGGEPIIYKLDTASNKITSQIYVSDVENIDWEALATNDTHFFIGDFGNNRGRRTDLSVFFFDKNNLDNESVSVEKIAFSYADWYEPAGGVHSTQFDAEAMLAFNDTIWIFTKCWEKYNTTIYKLPIEKGSFVLQPWISLDVDGLITAACHGLEKQEIWLTGYKEYEAFLWKLKYDDRLQTVQIENRWFLETPDSIQNEGLCFVNNELWISSEESKSAPAAIYKIDLDF
ncbi:MAG: hypothetical protein PHW19_02250 [Salinivirgaceae bacterium]|nr:hypothetical protein [Salinivirgaceae bacterium]